MLSTEVLMFPCTYSETINMRQVCSFCMDKQLKSRRE